MRSLLLGWGNSTPRQLAAYERLHRRVGLSPVTVIGSTLRGLVSQRLFARSVAPALDALEGNTCMVHLFSDNGFLAWAALLAAGADVRGVRAVLLDSSPGLWAARDASEVARRFSLGMMPVAARVLRIEPRPYVPAVTPALYGAFLAYQRLRPGWASAMRGAADVVLDRGPRCPHVFAFGGRDELVPAVNVRAFAARMGALAEVREHCFDDAGHVLLFPSDPKRYTRVVEETARRADADA
ncbi:MAG: DUF829 domain-containing protein [Myxococcales bacterium]|nr:DUF829 domain-containing protein [Myxococcales bacterium]